jgi:hypothetical protein
MGGVKTPEVPSPNTVPLVSSSSNTLVVHPAAARDGRWTPKALDWNPQGASAFHLRASAASRYNNGFFLRA